VKALRATQGVAASSETVSHGETATGRRDSDATALRCGCAAAAESRLTGSVAKRFRGAGRRARAGATVKFTHSKCGSGGWPGPHFFLALSSQLSAVSRQPSALSPQPSALRKIKTCSGSNFVIDVSLPVRLYFRHKNSPAARVATMTPKKIYFGNFFRSRYRTSTRRVRVLSRSRWSIISLKENSERNCENI
jgi:hypothetical protein